ncbi:unnamed protein product [Ranitomeya imitator]|uniref:Protein aurora borealis n=1 Tax=Ranitomeya imitator TaxID=111125 RepID=A0ABN9KSB7_9NEOB|nr:unnamed protein product [Ranitomeya imitator]
MASLLSHAHSRRRSKATHELKDNDTVEMGDSAESEDDQIWVKDAAGNDNTPMTSFMTGNTFFSVEMSHMCMSPLAESSVIPCDSSIQVDSGYTTQTCGSSIMDGISTDGVYKEIDTQVYENQNGSRLLKTKVGTSRTFESILADHN